MNKWIITISVMLPTLIEVIDTSIVNVSLDHIQGSLSASMDESTWTITSYLVSNAIIIPLSGWLSKMFGRKRYFSFSILLFTVSSLLCGMSWDLRSLVFFRILQGIGGGGLLPLSQSILLESFPPKQHGMAHAIFSIGIMTGPIIGPLVGGWISDNWSWQWIFFINLPIGVISLLMISLFIADPPYFKRNAKLKIDYQGLFFLVLGLGCLQIVLDRGQQLNWFESNVIVWLLVTAILSLTLFIVSELYAEDPVVDLRVFRNGNYRLGNALMFLGFFNILSTIVILPIYLQSLMGYTSTLAGYVLAPGGIASLVVLLVAGKIIKDVNLKMLLTAGAFVLVIAYYLMSKFNLHADLETVILPRIILGVGIGLFFVPLNTMTMSSIRKEEMGNAFAIYNLIRNLGGSVGVAFATTTLSRRVQYHHFRLIEKINPFSLQYQQTAYQTPMRQDGGAAVSAYHQGQLPILYKELLRQASMLSFNDVFFLISAIMACSLPLIVFMKTKRT